MPRGCGRVPHLPAPLPSKGVLDRHRVFGAQDLCGPGPDVGKQGRRPLAQVPPPSVVLREDRFGLTSIPGGTKKLYPP